MPQLLKLVERRASNPTGGTVGVPQIRELPLQIFQPTEQGIIVRIGNLRGGVEVVEAVVPVDFARETGHFSLGFEWSERHGVEVQRKNRKFRL